MEQLAIWIKDTLNIPLHWVRIFWDRCNKLSLGNHKNENLLFVFLCWKNRVLFKYIFCAISDVIAQIYDGINWTRPAWDSVFKSKRIFRGENIDQRNRRHDHSVKNTHVAQKNSLHQFFILFTRYEHHQSYIFLENIKNPSVMISFKIAWIILHGPSY